jgi:hypothetical protein
MGWCRVVDAVLGALQFLSSGASSLRAHRLRHACSGSATGEGCLPSCYLYRCTFLVNIGNV